MRKIIQLTAVPDPDGAAPEVFALCDDGTAWVALAKGWHRMMPIPQDDEEEA